MASGRDVEADEVVEESEENLSPRRGNHLNGRSSLCGKWNSQLLETAYRVFSRKHKVQTQPFEKAVIDDVECKQNKSERISRQIHTYSCHRAPPHPQPSSPAPPMGLGATMDL